MGHFLRLGRPEIGRRLDACLHALALLSYSVVLGFLFGYLWTRLFLAGALREADSAVLGDLVVEVQRATERAATTERKIDELQRQTELDAAALSLAYRQLNPSPDLPEATEGELDTAIAAASRPIRVQIFNQAWQVRRDNWRDEKKKPKMERTIPLFRALINNDIADRYHMNHGQLGFALKDSIQPNWEEAERELTKAIEIRGPWREHGWLFYELNRAICRIKNDPSSQSGAQSDAELKAHIFEALGAAMSAEGLQRIIQSDPIIKKSMSQNDVSLGDLRGT